MSSINNVPIWKENENRVARSAAMRSFLEANASLSDNLTGAGTSQSDGMSQIFAKVALKRMQAAAATKSAKQSADTAAAKANDQELAKVKARMAEYVKAGTSLVDVTV